MSSHSYTLRIIIIGWIFCQYTLLAQAAPNPQLDERLQYLDQTFTSHTIQMQVYINAKRILFGGMLTKKFIDMVRNKQFPDVTDTLPAAKLTVAIAKSFQGKANSLQQIKEYQQMPASTEQQKLLKLKLGELTLEQAARGVHKRFTLPPHLMIVAVNVASAALIYSFTNKKHPASLAWNSMWQSFLFSETLQMIEPFSIHFAYKQYLKKYKPC